MIPNTAYSHANPFMTKKSHKKCATSRLRISYSNRSANLIIKPRKANAPKTYDQNTFEVSQISHMRLLSFNSSDLSQIYTKVQTRHSLPITCASQQYLHEKHLQAICTKQYSDNFSIAICCPARWLLVISILAYLSSWNAK